MLSTCSFHSAVANRDSVVQLSKGLSKGWGPLIFTTEDAKQSVFNYKKGKGINCFCDNSIKTLILESVTMGEEVSKSEWRHLWTIIRVQHVKGGWKHCHVSLFVCLFVIAKGIKLCLLLMPDRLRCRANAVKLLRFDINFHLLFR